MLKQNFMKDQWSDIKENSDGIFDWAYILHKISDEKLVKLCGTDAALYLVFLRYCSNFFGMISIINIAFLVLYVSGNPA